MKVSTAAGIEAHVAALSLALLLFIPSARVAFGLPGAAYLIPLALLSALGARALLAKRLTKPVFAAAYVFVAVTLLVWLMLTATWTISPAQYQEDLVLIASLIFLLVSGLIVLSIESVRWTLVYVVAAAVTTTLWILAQYVAAGSLRGYDLALSESYLTLAQMIGIGAVGATVASLVYSRHRGLWMAGGIVSLLGVSLALARGALLSSIGVIVLASLYLGVAAIGREVARRRQGKVSRGTLSRLLLLSIPLTLVVATIYFALQVQRTAVMLRRFFSGNELARGGRGEIWEAAWNRIGDSPIWGHGLGSSGVLSTQADGGHAHNLMLQVWLDGGVFAMLMLAFLLVLPYGVAASRRRILRRLKTQEWLPFLAVYTFMILEFSKSSNFYSARGLFVFGLLTTFLLGEDTSPPKLFPQPDTMPRRRAARAMTA